MVRIEATFFAMDIGEDLVFDTSDFFLVFAEPCVLQQMCICYFIYEQFFIVKF